MQKKIFNLKIEKINFFSNSHIYQSSIFECSDWFQKAEVVDKLGHANAPNLPASAWRKVSM